MNIRTIALALALALTMPVTFTAHADTQQGHTMAHAMTDGVVQKFDMKRGMVTLKHDDVPGVMPAMTMAYRAADPGELEGLKAGDKVRFAMEKQGGEYVLIHIESMKP